MKDIVDLKIKLNVCIKKNIIIYLYMYLLMYKCIKIYEEFE